MIEISWTILASSILFLIGTGSVILANLISERNALRDMGKLMMTQRDEVRRELVEAQARLEAVREWYDLHSPEMGHEDRVYEPNMDELHKALNTPTPGEGE